MIDKTHLNLEGAKLCFFFTSIGNLYWEQCFLGVCVCSSLFKSLLLGTYCYWELVLGFFV